jgi:4,5-dihydroxyphthalate decarboxylase
MNLQNGVLHLSAALKRYPHTEGLIDGKITVPDLVLDCQVVEPIHRAFAPMARTQAYDVSEMAIVTFLQAKAYGKPLIMLPSVLAARLQQACIVYNKRRGPLGVIDLPGARVGVRAYTQTTGMWVRAILDGTYGVASDRIEWITFEGGHLEEYRDPAFVQRAPAGKEMLQMLLDGEIDAAIFGNDLPSHDDIAPLIPDPAAADQLWYAQHGFYPTNHVAVMRSDVAQAHPGAVQSVFTLLQRGKDAAADPVTLRKQVPDGIDDMRPALEMIISHCERQQLLPRKISVDEVFADSLAFLGAQAR